MARTRTALVIGLELVVVASVLVSCASRERKPAAKYHPAMIVNDLFPVEQGMPVREVRDDTPFFFKKCEILKQRPYFTKTEYDCGDAP